MNSDMCTFYVSLGDKNNVVQRVCTRTYRLLSQYKQEKSSNVFCIKGDLHPIRGYEKQNKYNNKNLAKIKNKQPKKCSLNNIKINEQSRKSKSSVCNGGNSHIIKRMFDKIHYKNQVRFITKEDVKFLRNNTQAKEVALFSLPTFVILLEIIFILIIANPEVLGADMFTCEWWSPIIIVFFIITVIVILRAIKLCRNIEKNEKLINVKNKLNYTNYPSLIKNEFFKN
ncbi:Plasmodium exported protein, unknown function [Plasmodium malariae]|uniref:Uncharacterized protein n=1 Tax=Plasmodium malariae TaxID=5858 RepID=A0A1D3JM67_PLAMA|nr:Plasmodium exported protein, unknown function [Plasmodium malariae]SBT87662.1 Plasmodium exported protein, unknown function [Plasmodium malariae]